MMNVNKTFDKMFDGIDEVLIKLNKIDEENLKNKDKINELLRLTKNDL